MVCLTYKPAVSMKVCGRQKQEEETTVCCWQQEWGMMGGDHRQR
jgi:hypothetical protein